jgi:putative transposase
VSNTAQPLLISNAALAAMKIDGLPSTKRGVRQLRVRQNWPTISADGRLQLIDVAALPDEYRLPIMAAMQPRILPKAANSGKRGAGRPTGTSFFDTNPHVAEAVTAWLSNHRYAATTIWDLLAASNIRPLPPIYTLRRFIKHIEEKLEVTLTALRDPDKAKSKYRVALGSADASASYAHQYWELDTTKADAKTKGGVMTKDGRRMILGVIDRYSRRTLFNIGVSESALSVRALLLRAITEWGVLPGTIIVDNGSGYINETVKTACAMLGIEHKPCPPASPERKPFVERVFGTFTRQRAVVLPGFTGHNVADAQKLRAKAKKETGRAEIFAEMTAEELQAILDNWTTGVYETRVHGGIGMSPLAKAMQSPIPATAAPAPEIVARALTAFVGNMVVGKRGLRWKGGRYWASELAAFIGTAVHVRRDEEDLGALLVFDDSGEFVCEAVNYERSGLSQQGFAMAARHHQQAHDKRAKAELREFMRRYPIERARAELLRADAEAAGKLATLPVLPVDAQPSRASIEPRENTARLHKLPQATKPVSADEIATRVARAEALIARASQGHDVAEHELAWANAFVAGPTYQWFKAEAAHAAGEPTPMNITSNRFNNRRNT